MQSKYVQPVCLICICFLVTGCLEISGFEDGYIGCGPSKYAYKMRFWEINIDDNSIEPLHRTWIDTEEGGVYQYTEIHGIDYQKQLMLYTEGAPSKMFQFDLTERQIVGKFMIDERGYDYQLSPDKQRFAYHRDFREEQVWMASIDPLSASIVPRASDFLFTRNPRWISDHQIVYEADSQFTRLGLYMTNIRDSSLHRITPKMSVRSYDVSKDGQSVLVEGPISDTTNQGSAIYYTTISNQKTERVIHGQEPHFLHGRNAFIYKASDQLHISNLNGDSKRLYDLEGTEIFRLERFAISPDGKNMVITKRNGVFLLNIDTKEVKKLASSEKFEPEDTGEWTTINAAFADPFFSANGNKVYVVMGRDYINKCT